MARIVLVVVVYEPDTVSTAVIAGGLARQLSALGHEVSVLSSVPHYNPPPEVLADRRYRTGFLRPFTVGDEDGVRVVRCHVPQKRGPTLRRAFQLGVLHLTLAIATLGRLRGTDVVVVVSPPLTLAFAAFALKALDGTKVVYNVQELWPDVPRQLGVITNPLLLGVLARMEQTIYRRADAVTPIGECFASVVRERGASAERVVVVPNFVDTGWIVPCAKRNLLSEEWGLADRPVVLYAGNVGLTQDFDLLLDAADKLPHVCFVVVGGGAGLDALRRQIADRRPANVFLHPYQPKERVADLYGMADVVAVPLLASYDRTTTPSKVFTAMAAGKPVLACAAHDTDLSRLLAQCSAGVTVSPGDVGGFVAAVERLMAGGAPEFDRAAALAAADRYSPAACAAAYDELIGSLTAGRAAFIPAPADPGGVRNPRGSHPALIGAKRFVARALCNRVTGLAVARLWGDRVPSCGYRIHTDSPAVAPTTKAAIFFRVYEAAELRFIRSHLRPDLDVVELGGSIGVVSVQIAGRLAPGARLICVEANPRLTPLLESNLAACGRSGYVVVNAAIARPGQEAVNLLISPDSASSRAVTAVTPATVRVPALSLTALLTAHDIGQYTLVADIEGGEISFIEDDAESLARCQQLIIELHEVAAEYGRASVEGLRDTLVGRHGFSIVGQHGPVFVFERR